jgi:gamma-glutamyl-gamma-aminobutyrate hydrolase PuuD
MDSRRPVIGVSVCLDPGRIHAQGRDYLYLRTTYTDAVVTAGGAPLLVPMPCPPTALEVLDGLVLTGGVDIHPRHYGEPVRAAITLEDERRVEADRRLLDRGLELGLPVLAVCYGMQLVNVHLGGTLVQRLPPSPVDHGAPGRERRHPVDLESGSLVSLAYRGADSTDGLSAHRQAVARLGSGLQVSARAADGVVEAFELEDQWLVGVQWHPEADPHDLGLYRQLIHAASS